MPLGRYDRVGVPRRRRNPSWRKAGGDSIIIAVLTLREVLDLEVFRRGRAETRAGFNGLDNEVRWVHICDLADVSQLLKGGELVMTTGLGCRDNPSLLEQFVKDLAAMEASGVVIELGRAFKEVPPGCIEQAERCGLPLIVLRSEIRFLEVTEQVHAAIINRQFEQLRKVEVISRDFTTMLLRGVDLKQIIDRLARLVRNPVVLEDVAHQVVDFADSGDGAIEEVLRGWEMHSRSRHVVSGGAERATRLPPRCVSVSVTVREEEWGRLHVLELDKTLDEVDRAAVDWAASAIGVTLQSERNVTVQTDHARRSFLGDILQSRTQAPKQLFGRARSLGAELESRRLVAIVVGSGNIDQLVNERGYSEDDRQAVRDALLEAVRAAAEGVGVSVLPGLDGDRVLAILGIPDRPPSSAAANEVALAVRRLVEQSVEDLITFVGLSEEAAAVSLRRAFDQASEAFDYGIRIGQPGVYRYADLGVHHLLLKMSELPDLARFVESELRLFLEHDAKTAVPLLPTLREYLAASQNKSTAARALGIDRRTLYQRLRRIETLLGRPLIGHEIIFRLALALAGLDVLLARGSTAFGVRSRPSRQSDNFVQ